MDILSKLNARMDGFEIAFNITSYRLKKNAIHSSQFIRCTIEFSFHFKVFAKINKSTDKMQHLLFL